MKPSSCEERKSVKTIDSTVRLHCAGTLSKDISIAFYSSSFYYLVKMAPMMAAVLRAPGKLCSFSYVLFVFFVVLRVRCC